MTKQLRILFYGLIVIIGILSFATSYLFTKSRNVALTESPKVAGELTSSPSNITTTITPTSSTTNRASNSSDRPSHPTDKYVIVKGDSLMTIAQKSGLTLIELSEANGIVDADKIQAGQNIIIPKGGQVNYTVDNSRATQLQAAVNNGKYSFRKDPVQTAQSDAADVYGISTSDIFTLKSKDGSNAYVNVSSNGKKYIIKLIQPIDKGDNGIWVIESISPEIK